MAIPLETITAYLKANHEQAQFINWGVEIKVCTGSAAGYYIGMEDPEDGSPLCRLSCEYYNTYEEAQEALDNGTFSAKLWL